MKNGYEIKKNSTNETWHHCIYLQNIIIHTYFKFTASLQNGGEIWSHVLIEGQKKIHDEKDRMETRLANAYNACHMWQFYKIDCATI